MSPRDQELLLPSLRAARWIANFAARHPGTAVQHPAEVGVGERQEAPDGSWYEFHPVLPVASTQGSVAEGPPLPEAWGVLLVRKGGYAVAALEQDTVVASKVGRRHVQGRTKAGGQSQQRFARRRGNQARDAYRAAADHAAAVLGAWAGRAEPSLLVVAGDDEALRNVLSDPHLGGLPVHRRHLDVHEPRRDTLEQFVHECSGWLVRLVDTTR